MALVPLQALGFEMGLAETNVASGATLPTISSTKAITGTYSCRFANTDGVGRSIPGGLSTLVLGGWFNHNGVGVSGNRTGIAFHLTNSLGVTYKVGYNNAPELRLLENSTTLTTADPALLGPVDTWSEWSVYFSAGNRFDFYVGSNLVMSHTTGIDAEAITSWMVGGRISIGWDSYLYAGDLCLYNAAGETTQPAPSRRFAFGLANGNGQVSGLTGQDADSTDNYLNVDDGVTPDDDTTYNEAGSTGLVDQYTKAAITSPAGWVPVALWPSAIAKKSDAALDIQLALGLWKASTDDDAPAVDLSTTYDLAQGRLTALPDGSALNDTNVNAAEMRVVSAGTYA